MTALVLAIDTTAEFGSIALVDQQRVLEEVPLHSPDGFAHILFDQIVLLLERHGLRLDQIDAFASAAGPGSFTGVRVGLTAVKGLAEATGRKALAISNLQALAWYGTRPLRAVVVDARRGEVYGAVYNASLHPVSEEVVSKLPAWLEGLPQGDLEFITNGYPIEAAGVRAPVTQAPRSLAGAIGVIAAAHYAAGLGQDPADIDANYVRRSDAELMWKDQG